MLEQCIERVLEEGEAVVEDLCAVHPQVADLLRRRVAALRGLGLLDDAGSRASAAADAVPERLGEYRLVELLGRGGMGAVYLAEHAVLARQVAVKVVRSDQLYFPGARERFRREVEAIASLQVPGVVPILDVGESEGVPFYVMELLEGVDLARVIRSLRALRAESAPAANALGQSTVSVREALVRASDSGSAPSDESGLFEGAHARVAARVIMRLARVVGRVHEHGIVHRDVKPSNVIVDRYGRVTLVDFGLAHLADAVELTQSGSVLGSLPYMAPEQVRGERADVGPRTDVYGLGVTLHELLYLEPAFEGGDPIDLRERICAGRRSVRGGVRDLETIIAQATDPDPARRYASADALADDLLRFLDHRMVRARRSGPWLRLYRWAQRHPARATAAGLLVLFAVAGPTAIAVERAGAAKDLQSALTETDRQRSNYEGALSDALSLVEDSTMRLLTHDAVAQDGKLDPVRKEALQAVAAFYERLGSRDPDSEVIHSELVKAKFRLVELLTILGEFERAKDIATQVLADTEGQVRWAGARFDARMRLGNVLDRTGDYEGARREWAGARAAFEDLGAGGFDARIRLGRGLLAHSHVLARVGDPAALEASREAVAWFEELARDHPDSTRALGFVAISRRALAQRLGVTREDRGQFALLQQTLGELRAFIASHPDDLTISSELGSTLDALADQYRFAGRDSDAILVLEEAIALRKDLLATWPDREVTAAELIHSLSSLGSALCRSDRPAEALPAVDAGIDLVMQRRSAGPLSHAMERSFATLHTWRAFALEHTGGSVEAAVESHTLAVATLESLNARESGESVEAYHSLAAARATAVAACYRMGVKEGVLEQSDKVIADLMRAKALSPTDGLVLSQLGQFARFAAYIAVKEEADVELAVRYLAMGIDEGRMESAALESFSEMLPEASMEALRSRLAERQ